MREFETIIREIRYLTQDVIELTVDLTSPGQIIFEAGQFMDFRFGKDVRSYSIVSVPDNNTSLQFCIEMLPNGVGSNFFRAAKIGDKLLINGPMGIFTVTDHTRDIFFVATGVGVAPFASMIPDMLGKGFTARAQLLFGIRHEENVFFFDRFRHLQAIYPNFKFVPLLSQPKSHWPGELGRGSTYLDVAYEYHKNSVFYVCGGMEMIKDVRALLLKKGHNSKDIKLEIFH